MNTTLSKREYQRNWELNRYKLHVASKLCVVCGTAPSLKGRVRCEGCAHKCNRSVYDRMIRDKILILTNYSPNKILGCSWPDCKVKDMDMLVLDHMNGDGAEHRRSLKGSAKVVRIRRDLILRNFPPGYQTLCSNHNLKKEMVLYRQARDAKS
jgi:hypothetical protein